MVMRTWNALFLLFIFGNFPSILSSSANESPDHEHNITTFRINLNYSCSSQLGQLGQGNCSAVTLKIFKFKISSFEMYGQKYDDNFLVRVLCFNIRDQDHAKNSPIVGQALDAFLTPRPWWLLIKEKSIARGVTHNDPVHQICLSRLAPFLEPHIRMLAKLQFPSQNGCETSKLTLGHHVNRGWGSTLNFYGTFWGDNPFTIFDIWDSNSNLPGEGVVYASNSTCRSAINKRACAFLPLTNCSTPAAVTSRTGPDASALWPHDLMTYFPATATGTLLSSALDTSAGTNNAHDPTSEYHKHLFSLYGSQLGGAFRTSRFIDGNGRDVDQGAQGAGPTLPVTRSVLASHGLIFRPNAQYRAMATRRVSEFRSTHGLREGAACVTVHVHRSMGGRPGANMSAFCKQHKARSASRCVAVTVGGEVAVDCQVLRDAGCFGRYAVGEPSLMEYLALAARLHASSRNLLVVTDDPTWVHSEWEKLTKEEQRGSGGNAGVGAGVGGAGVGMEGKEKEWSIAVMGLSPDTPHDSPHATDNAVDFLAAVSLAKQCRAFVGHWGSATSQLLYHAMCMGHGNKIDSGKCPNACDMSLPRVDSF